MSLEDLLRSIHRLEDLPRLCGALGFVPGLRELPQGGLPGNGAAAIVAAQRGFAWYAVAASGSAAAGKVARTLAARGLSAAVLGLDQPRRRLSVAALDARPLDLSLDAPDPLALARLRRCAARSDEAGVATAIRIAEALSGRGVDDRFFAAFRGSLQSLTGALPGGVPLADRHALALLQLTRILFLYFVEARGWLAGRPRFLREEVDRCLVSRRSLQRDLLHPLFFGTLNRPYADRGALARRFGPIPFLNGGLFEPHPLERRWRCSLPTPSLRDAFDTLFERFHFTLSPSSEDAVAPDMLGRVFERVMEPGERHRELLHAGRAGGRGAARSAGDMAPATGRPHLVRGAEPGGPARPEHPAIIRGHPPARSGGGKRRLPARCAAAPGRSRRAEPPPRGAAPPGARRQSLRRGPERGRGAAGGAPALAGGRGGRSLRAARRCGAASQSRRADSPGRQPDRPGVRPAAPSARAGPRGGTRGAAGRAGAEQRSSQAQSGRGAGRRRAGHRRLVAGRRRGVARRSDLGDSRSGQEPDAVRWTAGPRPAGPGAAGGAARSAPAGPRADPRAPARH